MKAKTQRQTTENPDQTERRVMPGEQVSAAEKVVSLFECHTDVIVKGGRDTQYGHKIVLTGGSSGLIFDCLIEPGNPARSLLGYLFHSRRPPVGI